MNSIHIRAQVDNRGCLHLTMPAEYVGQMLDLVVVFEPVLEQQPTIAQSHPVGWPPGVYEATAGAWQGEELVREPEGAYEVRNTLP